MIVFLAFAYVIAWFVFAVNDFKGSDTIVAYSLMPTSELRQDYPEMLYVRPTIYRVSDQNVIEQIKGFEPSRYSDCAVVDVENWVCTHDDKSGKFGFTNGTYYEESLLPDGIGVDEFESVSRFGWIWNHIEWTLVDKDVFGIALISVMPFFI